MDKEVKVKYEDLRQCLGSQNTDRCSELITYLIGNGNSGRPGEQYSGFAAILVVLGDLLIEMGLSQLSVVLFLRWAEADIVKDIQSFDSALNDYDPCVLQHSFIQILDSRWVLVEKRPIYDLETRMAPPDITPCSPVVSVCVNVTALWSRTIAKLIHRDASVVCD